MYVTYIIRINLRTHWRIVSELVVFNVEARYRLIIVTDIAQDKY